MRNRRITPSLVLSVAALAFALTGSAVALPGSNRVDSNDLRANVVRSKHVVNGSLTGDDIKRASVPGTDLQNDSVTGQQVQESTLRGVMASQVRYVSADSAQINGGAGTGSSTASCASNEKAIGGSAAWIIPGFQGGNVVSQLAGLSITGTTPAPDPAGTDGATGWTAYGRNQSGTNRILRAYAVCVPKQIQ